MAAARIRRRTHKTAPGKPGYKFDRPILVVEDQKSTADYTAAMVRDRWNCEAIIAGSLREGVLNFV